MRRSVVLLVLVACDREADQRVHCNEVAETYLVQNLPQFVEQCVKGGWSKKQMACHAQNAGMAGMFCDD